MDTKKSCRVPSILGLEQAVRSRPEEALSDRPDWVSQPRSDSGNTTYSQTSGVHRDVPLGDELPGAAESSGPSMGERTEAAVVVWEPEWIGLHEPDELPNVKAVCWAVFWFLFAADSVVWKVLMVIWK